MIVRGLAPAAGEVPGPAPMGTDPTCRSGKRGSPLGLHALVLRGVVAVP